MSTYRTAKIYDQDEDGGRGEILAILWELTPHTLENSIAEIVRHSKNVLVEYGTIDPAVWLQSYDHPSLAVNNTEASENA
jgi:hypothetical protein